MVDCAAPRPPRGSPGLLVANLAVANTIGLSSGLGGLRTPSTAANLLLAALLVSLPWLGSLRRSLAPLTPLAGAWERIQQRVFVGVVCLAAFPVVAGDAWVLGWALLCLLLAPAAIVPLAELPDDLPLAPFGIGLALLLAVGAPWPPPHAWLRWAWRLLRLRAFALPWGWLGLVAAAGLWTPGAFVDRDPMHEPIAKLPAAWGRVEVVRVNAGAFADHLVRIDRVAELGPAIEWRWRLLARGDCGEATLVRDGGTLVVRSGADDAEHTADARGRPAEVRVPPDGTVGPAPCDARIFARCTACPGCSLLPCSRCLASVSSVFSVVPSCCCWRSRPTTEDTENTERRSAEQGNRRYGSRRNGNCGAYRTA